MTQNCRKCRSSQTKKNGYNSDGKQKYKCKKCWFCFVRKKSKQPKIKTKYLLEEYIQEWYVHRQLAKQSGKDMKQLQLELRKQLDKYPISQIDEVYEDVCCVTIDGTWIRKGVCMLVYYEYNLKKVLYVSSRDEERQRYIEEDLRVLKQTYRYNIQYFVIDWDKNIKKAVQSVYPKAYIQRCWVHIHRQVNNYLGQRPRLLAAQELKRIAQFSVFEDKRFFFLMFYIWEQRWKQFLSERNDKGNYKYRRIRQAYIHLKNAKQDMYAYRYDTKYLRDTNHTESLFAAMDMRISTHKWLRIDRLQKLTLLWLYLGNIS